uniref:Uncharacterized protein n=1 Tax=Trichuris muris TaxID=70415 RepID=A0A5S6QXC3_TRIMR
MDLRQKLEELTLCKESVFDFDSYYECARKLCSTWHLLPFIHEREFRYERDTLKNVEVVEIPFIKDASIALVYFVRHALRFLLSNSLSYPLDPYVVLGLQCFEIDNVTKRRELFNLQFSNHEKADSPAMKAIREDLRIIEERRTVFKQLATEKSQADLFDKDVKTTSNEAATLFEGITAALGCSDKFLSQLVALEANLFEIRSRPVPKRNEWALNLPNTVLQEELLELLDFAATLCKQPPEEAAKFVCMWSTVLFQLYSKSAPAVQKSMKGFPDLFVSITKNACTIKGYSLSLRNLEKYSIGLHMYKSTALVAGLEIVSQADNSKTMNLLKRSRRHCYIDSLKYRGMKAVRLALQAAEDFGESAKSRTAGIPHSCHVLKLFFREFSNFDTYDSALYARVLSDDFFRCLGNSPKSETASVYGL